MKKDSELEGNSVAELIETETVEIDDLDVTADFSTDEIADTAQSGKSLRGRIMMYTQRVDRIINNCGSLANFEDCIRTTVCDVTKGDHYAIILHDKDKSSVAGKAFADPHIHVAFEFQNARHAIAIVKVLNDFRDDGSPNVQAITIFKGNVGNLYSYLCHRTKKSSHKYQYDPSVVKASFDYVKKLENITAQVNTAKQVKEASSKLNMVLEELRSRNITLQDIEKTLPASVYARNVNNIRNVWSLAMKLEAQEWRERKIRSGERTNVIWIWGKSATGKSSFGRDYVSKDGKEHYIAGSSSAMWDGYESYMHLALLDECRPDMFKTYRDMLSILDNYQSRAVAPARYYDRELALDTIVITTVYSPYEFYKHMDIKDSTVDEFYQLERRITECIHMDDYFMMNSYFNPVERRYEVDVDSLVCNPYSEVRRGTKKEKHDRSTYSSIVHSAPMVSAHDEILNENYDDEDNMTDDELISDELYSDELLYDDYTDEDMSLVEVIAQLEELEDFYDDSDFDEGGEEENE